MLIELTHVDGHPVFVETDFIVSMERLNEETVIRVDGAYIRVKETTQDIFAELLVMEHDNDLLLQQLADYERKLKERKILIIVLIILHVIMYLR